ncbi:MAG: MerR family transcriptional regulator [Acidobacteria bacterium]|nr:MerR family transcriptional regulator [Acidobacteriota bacterium]
MPPPAAKLWFKIGEMAQKLGISPKDLRYWESGIPEIRPRRSKGNLRYYHLDELPRLERIRGWIREGLTVDDCRQLLRTGQLARGLGLFEEADSIPQPVPARRKGPSSSAPELKRLKTALEQLLERLSRPPRPAPRAKARLDPAPPGP